MNMVRVYKVTWDSPGLGGCTRYYQLSAAMDAFRDSNNRGYNVKLETFDYYDYEVSPDKNGIVLVS